MAIDDDHNDDDDDDEGNDDHGTKTSLEALLRFALLCFAFALHLLHAIPRKNLKYSTGARRHILQL